MTNWIEDKAAQTQAQTESSEKRLAQGHQTLDQLEIIVRRDIENWNGRFRQKIDGIYGSLPGRSFKVRKTSFPSATADVFLDTDSSTIQFDVIRRRAKGDGVQTLRTLFHLKPAANGSVSLTTQSEQAISLEEVSRVLLETIVESAPGTAKPS